MTNLELFLDSEVTAWVCNEAEGNERLSDKPDRAYVSSKQIEGYSIKVGDFSVLELDELIKTIREKDLPHLNVLEKVRVELLRHSF